MQYARIHRLTDRRPQDPGPTFQRLAELLSNCGDNGILRFTLLSASGSESWSLAPHAGSYRLSKDAPEVPDLELISKQETWWEIAEGSLSPLEAFALGRMRVLGDFELGTKLLRHLAIGGGAASFCGE
jgi:hypothetical protein